MQVNDQKQAFIRIIKASFVNVLGFGLATYVIDYLAKNTNLGTPIVVLALFVCFVMFVSISSLITYIYHTAKEIPATMAKTAHLKFTDIYGYVIYALVIRIIEASICVGYIVYIYRIFI